MHWRAANYICVAANGQEAVDIYHKGWAEISLVLLDLTMPVMSGEVTLRKLQNIRPEIKVVLSSGYNELEALQRFASKDLAGFIQKPYTAQQLAQKVKSVLEEESLH